MICSICQINEATIHILRIEKDYIVKIHICEECLSKGYMDRAEFIQSDIVGDIFFVGDTKNIICPHCNTTYKEFESTELLGCPHCAITFEEKLKDIVESKQGKDLQHIGKTPIKAKQHFEKRDIVEMKIFNLEKRLKSAITNEEYEKAAKIRDRIKELKSASK